MKGGESVKVELSKEMEKKRQEAISEQERINNLSEKLVGVICQEKVSLNTAECALSRARNLVRTRAVILDQSSS